jgi:hypothetical protein
MLTYSITAPNKVGTWGRKQIQFPQRYVFELFRIPDNGQSSQTQQFLVLYTFVKTRSIVLRFFLLICINFLIINSLFEKNEKWR